MAPSLKRLRLITSAENARTIRAMILGERDPREVCSATDQWARACYNPPSAGELALHAADVLLGTFGVEGWASESGRGGVSYCNAGDPYALTLILRTDRYGRERFSVGAWEGLA